MKKDRYFRTTNLNLGVFLYAQNQPIAGVNPVAGDQKEFAFLDVPRVKELVDLYKFGDRNDVRLSVEVHRYEQARRDLLDRLND